MKAALVSILVSLAAPAWAEADAREAPAASAMPVAPEPAPAGDRLRLGWFLDGSLAMTSTVALGASTLIPVGGTSTWKTQLLPIDDHLKGRYSAQAAHTSDVLLGVDVALPVALFAGRGFDSDTATRVAVYGETLLVALALDSVVKPLVGRPRPYTYSSDPAVMDYAKLQGRDARLSFYSGHASTTFAASVSGAYLFAQSTTDTNARAAVWGVELALASATADLRTRAGMHFYSDVLSGALIGASLGVLIPYLHGGPKVHLSKLEWLAIILGPLAGVVLGELLPVSGA